jgi:hypothetical protein
MKSSEWPEAKCSVKVGYNARVPIKDMTLPRGGGPDGKSPVAVLKETQICKCRSWSLAGCGRTYRAIVYSLLSMQRRKDLGVEDVDVWRPERWGTCHRFSFHARLTQAFPETWRPGNKWEYVPFNYGPRICIGQAFANFQMEYFFVRLCQEFESISLLPESKSQEGLMRLELNTKTAHAILTKSVRVAR